MKVKKVVFGSPGQSSAIDPNLEANNGARWGVALHCSMLAGSRPGYHPRGGRSSKRRVGYEGSRERQQLGP